MAGYTASYGAGDDDFWLVKVATEVEAEVHDVAVTDINAKPSHVRLGQPICINVTVQNQGDFPKPLTSQLTRTRIPPL